MLSNRDWKSIAELVGVIALVLSLVFIGLQMRQTNDVAFMELDTAMVGISVDIAELVSGNSDIWIKGNAGEDLSAAEAAVYYELIAAISTRWVVSESHADQLGRIEIADLILRDWAAFLHQNPGARRVWSEREENLIRYRRLLAPDGEDFSSWRDRVQAELAVLDDVLK